VTRRKTLWALVAAAVLAMSVLAACGDDDDSGDGGGGDSGGGDKPKVAVLLPDSKSSVRWETVDRPLLQKALEAGGLEATITNAEGDKSAQQQQAEQAITNGAKVILLVNLDSGSGAAIAANAKSQGVKVIDYDRLTLDTDAQDYYVSFDNKVDGVLAANDGLGNAAISALKQRKLPQIPVTGQDATLEGIQNIVNGDQCMTVYKAIEKEANAAAELAIALAKGEKPTVQTVPIDNGTHDVPSVLEKPVAVTKDNISEYFGAPDYPTKEDICAGKVAANCEKLGL